MPHKDDERASGTPALQTGAVILAIIAALYLGQSLAIPIAIAVLVSFSLGPLVTWLRRRGIARIASVAAVVVPALSALIAFTYLIVTQVGYLAENLPAYQTNVEGKIRSLEASLPAQAMLDKGSAFIAGLRNSPFPHTASRPADTRGKAINHQNEEPMPVEIKTPDPTPLSMLTGVAAPLIGPVMQFGLVLLFVVFFLVERETLRDRVIRLAGSRDLHRTTMAMDEAGHRVSRFLLLQLVVNSGFGSAIGLGLWLIGVPNPALWGCLAVLFRFVPYLGVAAASAIPIILAVAVDPGWSTLFWTAGLFLGLELVTGNIVEPRLYGSSTGLSPVAFVISMIFWTWLWGAVGLLIATPLTVCIAVLGRYVPQLGFLHILLGNEAPLRPEESFYQRLLAGHPEEAAQQAEEYLKNGGGPAAFCDEIVLPALTLAERDRTRGVLDDSGRQSVLDGLRTVIDDLEDDARRFTHPVDALGDDSVAFENPPCPRPMPGRVILCIPGRGALDEAASVVICKLLSLAGHDAQTTSAQSIATGEWRGSGIPHPFVLLSYMDQASILHAKYISRRLRRLFGPEVEVFAGFWGADDPLFRNPEMISSTGLNGIATSFQAALGILSAEAPMVPSLPFPAHEPDLDALARLASEVVAKPA